MPTVDWPGINPYELMKDIAKWTTAEDIIVSDTGCALGWVMQGFPFKGERFLHAFNMTPMGYGLPAAIGAHFATGRRVVLITGDGSIMMSLPELATISRWNLPIKIILLNNGGHAMCRQTQRQWLGANIRLPQLKAGWGFRKIGARYSHRSELRLCSRWKVFLTGRRLRANR
jgi:acetolactate synthase-1/2/3 large subunit